jgi:hypothetical protein
MRRKLRASEQKSKVFAAMMEREGADALESMHQLGQEKVYQEITLFLTLAIPATLAYVGTRRSILARENLSYILPLIVGVSMSLLLFTYSVFAAHPDGRFLWTAYPFLIPIGLTFFQSPRRYGLTGR